jgi:hypothetical protein
MNLPIQAPPVMRGQDRHHVAAVQSVRGLGITQSQAAPPLDLKKFCAACIFAPPPWNLVCSALCPVVVP